MNPTPLSLLELNLKIKKTVRENIETCWIVGEISELKINYSGHCYLELIQKDESSDQVVARSKATIWASHFRMIKPYFETTTRQPLSSGLSIMVKVKTDFHELYGLSLNITDIEPTYTVGELAIRRQRIIEKLQDEGVFGMNKELEFPYLCRKIAVISSHTAAGYEDFVDQLLNNHAGYKFYVKLFSAAMQGNDSEDSIIAALELIYEYEHFFDVVVIIRGGGSKADLGCFDNYRIAYHITQFPIPVITGIGHEQDDSVADLVAHIRLKTPTAVAAFLLDRMTEQEGQLSMMQEQILDNASSIINDFKEDIQTKVSDFQLLINKAVNTENTKLIGIRHKLSSGMQQAIYRSKLFLNKSETQVDQFSTSILIISKHALQHKLVIIRKSIIHQLELKKNRINNIERATNHLDPNTLLKRGYSVTKAKGKVLINSRDVEEGDIIETILYKGKLKSQIKKT